VITLALLTTGNPADRQPGIEGLLTHAVQIAAGAFHVLATAMEPFGSPLARVVVLVVLAVAAVAGWLALRLSEDDPLRATLRRWLGIGACAVFVIAVGYVMFVPGPSGDYEPPGAGITERNNVLAAFGWAILVWSLVVIAASLVARAVRRPAAAGAVAGVLLAFIAVGYVIRIDGDKAAWASASAAQERVLAVAEPSYARLPEGGTIFAFDYPAAVAPKLPSFWSRNDLASAVKIASGDPTLDAQPFLTGMVAECGADGIAVTDTRYALPPIEAAYGMLALADVEAGRVVLPRNRTACQRFVSGTPPATVAGGRG
jgi:hypothetical protein